jgi:hypothetical protein
VAGRVARAILLGPIAAWSLVGCYAYLPVASASGGGASVDGINCNRHIGSRDFGEVDRINGVVACPVDAFSDKEKAKGVVELGAGIARVLVGRKNVVEFNRISRRNKREHDLRLVVEGSLGASDGRQNRQQIGRLGGSIARPTRLAGNHVVGYAGDHNDPTVQAEVGIVRGEGEFSNLGTGALVEEHVVRQVNGHGEQGEIGAHQYILRQPLGVVAGRRGIHGNILRPRRENHSRAQ